jgi:hypothetical protein
MALRQSMKRLASQIFLGDLALELDGVGTVLGHGLSSFESPAYWSNLKLGSVRPQGPTPPLEK